MLFRSNKDGSLKKTSWVRNGLRTLVKYKLARRMERGVYEWTGEKLEDVVVDRAPRKRKKAAA